MKIRKTAREMFGTDYIDTGCQYAAAFGALSTAVELFYNHDLDEAKSLEDLKRRFREMFDKYMEEK